MFSDIGVRPFGCQCCDLARSISENAAACLLKSRHAEEEVALAAAGAFGLTAPSPELDPGPYIVWLNRWLRDYARRSGSIYADYHALLEDGKLGIRDGLSNDGLHPNRRGFEIMTPLAEASIDTALKRRAGDHAARPR